MVKNQIAQLKAAAEAETGDEMFEILGRDGYMLRIDPDVKPEMFHYATISEGEVDLLRQIKQVIRHGRVSAIEPGKMVFADCEETVPEDALFIDCTATAVPFSEDREHGPQFRGDTITLQPLHVPLVTLSAAISAFLEVHFDDDATKNALGTPSPLTDTPNTYPLGMLINFMNRGAWSQNPKIAAWLHEGQAGSDRFDSCKTDGGRQPEIGCHGRIPKSYRSRDARASTPRSCSQSRTSAAMRIPALGLLLAALALGGCMATSARNAHPEASVYSAEHDANADVNAALERATASGRNVLVVMGANWCHDSRALAGWMETPRFQTMLTERFETAYVDVGYPQGDRGRNIDIAQRFGIRELVGTPTVLVLSPHGTLLNADTAGTWRNAASRSEDAIFVELAAYPLP